jgi:hypothetical protein
VLFVPFIKHGLGLPTCSLLHGFLHYFGITLNHLPQNAILHLSIFVHLCETFPGIPPSITLFHYFFKLKPHPDATNPHVLGVPVFSSEQGKRPSISIIPWLNL